MTQKIDKQPITAENIDDILTVGKLVTQYYGQLAQRAVEVVEMIPGDGDVHLNTYKLRTVSTGQPFYVSAANVEEYMLSFGNTHKED